MCTYLFWYNSQKFNFLENDLVPACSKNKPDQVEISKNTNSEDYIIRIKYYFDSKNKLCKPFLTYTLQNEYFSFEKNNFNSILQCQSYCPASKLNLLFHNL